MTTYISYLRVSTQRQGQSGLGLEAQRTAVEQFLTRSGGALLAEYVEIESGSRKARPILVQAIAHSRRIGATLLIAKLDRLARNVAFVSSLMESGVEFVAADAPYANRLMIHILAAFAEHEREQISTRTRDALRAAKARGVQLGGNGHVLAAKHRSEAMQVAEAMRFSVEQIITDGITTLAAISRSLNQNGLKTRMGASWTPGTTQRLLRRLDINPRLISSSPG